MDGEMCTSSQMYPCEDDKRLIPRDRRLEAVRLALPEEEPPQKLETRGSESLSLESCGTPMVSSHDVATDGPHSDSDSGGSETTAAHLANNPYALVDEQQVDLPDPSNGVMVPLLVESVQAMFLDELAVPNLWARLSCVDDENGSCDGMGHLTLRISLWREAL